jgi:anti-sigma factor RsiW
MTIVGIHPEDLFDKLLDGELLPAERERLRAHLDSCEVCRFEYEARLDFQQEAVELGAMMSAPPALPFRPLPAAETARRSTRVAAPVPRRSRTLVWGLAAAALITASGAVASSMAGKVPWRAVSLLFAQRSAPAERIVASSGKRAAVHAAVVSVVAAPSAAGQAPVAAAPLVTQALPAPHDVHAQAVDKRREPTVAPASLKLAVPAAGSGDVTSAKGEPAKEPASAAKLFGEANQARRSGDVGRASGLYHLLQDQFPGSPEAELSRVTLALLLLDNGDPRGALSGFERYLAGSSRGLEAEALVGRARAFGRLGRRDEEAAAWREVQRKYSRSIYGRQATERLLALGRP